MKAILIVVFSLVTCVAYAQPATEKKLAWDYPVKPRTDEWNKMTSHQEAVDACQIPEELFSSLSTEDLTVICLQYPLLAESLFSCNSYDQCLTSLFKEFNGIGELFKREDTAKELMKQYHAKIKNLSYLEGKDSDTLKGLFIVSIAVLEILITHYDSPNSLTKENNLEILQVLMVGYEQKMKYPNYFGSFALQTNFFARAKIIVKMDEQKLERIPQKDQNSVFLLGRFDEPTTHVINELSYQLIKEK